jgi:alcohol dehydrogenase class IV
MFFQDREPTEDTLPIVAVPTTSGTGSHTTLYAVITNTEHKVKSGIGNPNIFPRCAIVDPTLMISLPARLTACTGFDAFSHAFESYVNVSATPMTDILAMEAIRLIAKHLPAAIEDGEDIEARTNLAWADTLAGVCISNAGTTLPHAMGQPISGHFPQVSHGESLAAIYPAFLRYTCGAAPEKFIAVGEVFNAAFSGGVRRDVQGAVGAIEGFMRKIGMWMSLKDLGIAEEDLEPILQDCMAFPDVRANPRVPDLDETRELYLERLR